MTDPSRVRWGIAGLLGFEAILVWYTATRGATDFLVMSMLAAVLLALALWRGASAWILAGVAAVALARAVWQVAPGTAPAGVLPTFLIPTGFALLALAASRPLPALATWGIVLVALARTWFIFWYFGVGNAALGWANLSGATGAWVWVSAIAARPETTPDARPGSAVGPRTGP